MWNRSHIVQLILFFGVALPSAPVLAQGILIGPSTRNGSFESGIASPWLGILATNDPTFASDGSWYAVGQDTANGPTSRAVSSLLALPAVPADGLAFVLAFDARNAAVGFDSVYGQLEAWNADGTAVLLSVTPIKSPPLVSSSWVRYETRFDLPETWDGGGSFRVGVQFTKQDATVGTTYSGYLDNIVLQQIPEPAVVALLYCGVLALGASFSWNQLKRGGQTRSGKS